MKPVILTIVGARPQFIKAAATSRGLLKSDYLCEQLVHTGQHYDFAMSQQFFEELGLPAPTVNLEVGSASHGAQTGRIMEGLEALMLKERPRAVMVFGDTNSTLAGALVAAKLHIPIAHVEAGLRSFNRQMPEEINRVLTDHCSTLLFAPTEAAVQHLASEGINEGVSLVGDVMFDAAVHFAPLAQAKSTVLEQNQLKPKGFVLATIHRAESTDDPSVLRGLFTALIDLSQQMRVVMPLHPRTRSALQRIEFMDTVAQSLTLLPPQGYLDMLQLEAAAKCIVTDSGGVQKEAFFAQTPCITLRTETEWTELVDLGWNQLLSPAQADQLPAAVRATCPGNPPEDHLYGGGNAAQRIRHILEQQFG